MRKLIECFETNEITEIRGISSIDTLEEGRMAYLAETGNNESLNLIKRINSTIYRGRVTKNKGGEYVAYLGRRESKKDPWIHKTNSTLPESIYEFFTENLRDERTFMLEKFNDFFDSEGVIENGYLKIRNSAENRSKLNELKSYDFFNGELAELIELIKFK